MGCPSFFDLYILVYLSKKKKKRLGIGLGWWEGRSWVVVIEVLNLVYSLRVQEVEKGTLLWREDKKCNFSIKLCHNF